MSNPLSDMEKPDVIFCIGTNMTECHPVAATRLKKALARGAKMIVADPRRIRLAEMADIYLPIRVGSDAALLLAMAHVIAREELIDEEFVRTRTTGMDEFCRSCPALHARVGRADHRRARGRHRGRGSTLWRGRARGHLLHAGHHRTHLRRGQRAESGQSGADDRQHRPRGHRHQPHARPEQHPGRGRRGAIPNNYPGFQPVDDPANQAKFEALYGREIDLARGITKVTAFDQAGDGIHAMLIDGENSLVSDPDRSHCEHALRSLDHLVVIDIFLTETAELADVVLPATAWAEIDGTFTNTERRIQRVRRAVDPPGQASPTGGSLASWRNDWAYPGFEYSSAAEIFNELCELSPIYAGVDWDLIDDGQYQWPIPYRGHPGTPRLHEEEFINGLGKFSNTSYRDPAETIDDDYPVWLTTGRRLESYHTRTQTGRAQGIDYLLSEETLEVHPDDVANWHLQDGGWCRMSSRRGAVQIKVEATRRSPRGHRLRQLRLQRRAHQRPHRLRLRSDHTDRRVESLSCAG